MSVCPDCASWKSKTLATRKDTRYNWTWRKKKCLDCGEIWKTYEIPADNIGYPESLNPDGRLEQ